VSVRGREGDAQHGVPLDEFLSKAVEEAASRSLQPSTFEPS
jgi:hypothetical protein